MTSPKYRVIDYETGEDLTGDYSLRHRDQDEGYRKALDKERFLHAEKGRHWVASYHDAVTEVSRLLTLTETGAIIKLLPYMRFKAHGKLIKDGKALKQADIQRIFKRGKTATVDLLRTLEDKGVISVVKEGRSNAYYISARFHEIGSVDTAASFTKLYQVRTRQITDDLDLNEAGVLYKILPYFHFSECVLVANPNETDIEALEYVDNGELADRVGLDRSHLTRTVAKLRSKGAIMTTTSGKSTRYYVHPDLMYRQARNTKTADAVRTMFERHRK